MRKVGIHSVSVIFCILLAGACSAPTKKIEDPIFKVVNEVVGDAKVVALGEPSHFLEGIHEFNFHLFKFLVQEKGFRVFCFESFWNLEFAINDFINSDREDLSNFEGFLLNAFNSSQSKNLLLFIREFNKQNPNDHITVIGYQPEQPVSDTKAIVEFFGSTSFDFPGETEVVLQSSPFIREEMSNDLDAVIYTSTRRKEGLPGYTEEEYEPLIVATDLVYQYILKNATEIASEVGENAFVLIKQRAISLHAYAVIWMKGLEQAYAAEDDAGQSDFTSLIYQGGDSVRLVIFNLTMSSRLKGKKALVWMHNWHAAKKAELSGGNPKNGHPPYGTRSFGSRLSRELGTNYVVIGSIVACEECDYDRSKSLEDRFYRTFKSDTVMINLKNPEPGYSHLPLNERGTYWVQAGSSNFEEVNLSEQFDAVYYLPKSDLTVGKPK